MLVSFGNIEGYLERVMQCSIEFVSVVYDSLEDDTNGSGTARYQIVCPSYSRFVRLQ